MVGEEGVLSEATNLLLGQVDTTRRKYAHEAEELRVGPLRRSKLPGITLQVEHFALRCMVMLHECLKECHAPVALDRSDRDHRVRPAS